MAGNLKKENV